MTSAEAGSYAVVSPNRQRAGRNDYMRLYTNPTSTSKTARQAVRTDSNAPATASNKSSHLKHGLVLVGSAPPELVVDLEGPSVILILRIPPRPQYFFFCRAEWEDDNKQRRELRRVVVYVHAVHLLFVSSTTAMLIFTTLIPPPSTKDTHVTVNTPQRTCFLSCRHTA